MSAGLTISLFLNAILLVATIALVLAYLNRKRWTDSRSIFKKDHVRHVALAELGGIFSGKEFEAIRNSEVKLLANIESGPGTSVLEGLIISALCKQARCMFEFGTASGSTTYLMALNSPPDATVGTITLTPDTLSDYSHDAEDREKEHSAALRESWFQEFWYQGSVVESKVEQFLGDSKKFDHSDFKRRCDLIFIDGSHAHSYVQSDSEKAFEMIHPNGTILWHDYTPRCRGVFSVVNKLAQTHDIVHIKGTRLAAYRRSNA